VRLEDDRIINELISKGLMVEVKDESDDAAIQYLIQNYPEAIMSLSPVETLENEEKEEASLIEINEEIEGGDHYRQKSVEELIPYYENEAFPKGVEDIEVTTLG